MAFNINTSLHIGNDVLIASGCRFADINHGINQLDVPIRQQHVDFAPIVVENGAWLGVNCAVLKGVTIGEGAVIGAGAIVTKSVPAYEIWAGVPARKIGDRRVR